MGTVEIEEIAELPHPPEAVWPILSKTDWLNRSIGLPPVHYEIRPRPEGGSHIIARAKILGLSLSWQEFPFEWAEPHFYQVRRIFNSGPLAEGILGVRLKDSDVGCAIEAFACFTPRNVIGEFFARHILGPKTKRDMRGLIRHVGKHLAGEQRRVMPKLSAATPNKIALDEGLKILRQENLPAPLVNRLAEMLTDAADVELSRIRPFAMARQWREDRWTVLRLFLHATRAGLLNLSWEVLCPNCRSTRMPRNTTLRDLARTAHCDVCNIKFDAEFDQSVELKFSVHPAIRPCDEQTFCLVGPGGKPHVVAQIVVEPGQSRIWDLPEVKFPRRVCSLQVKEAFMLPSGDGPAHAVDREIICHPDRFEVRLGVAISHHPAVRISNPNSYPVQLSLEASEWDGEILTAARVTNWQEFRDLFTQEVISPLEQVSVGFQVVLFTDLRGSTAMYGNLGDAPAYVLVRDHFRILFDAVAAHHGAVVKTIGDAIMAVFSDLPEALAAVKQMHAQLPEINLRQNARLRLKAGLHAGPCLAINANDRLDFFGTTVNLAARLVDYGEGDDLVIVDELYERPEAQSFLKEIRRGGTFSEKQFSGFMRPVKVWRIPLAGNPD